MILHNDNNNFMKKMVRHNLCKVELFHFKNNFYFKLCKVKYKLINFKLAAGKNIYRLLIERASF